MWSLWLYITCLDILLPHYRPLKFMGLSLLVLRLSLDEFVEMESTLSFTDEAAS